MPAKRSQRSFADWTADPATVTEVESAESAVSTVTTGPAGVPQTGIAGNPPAGSRVYVVDAHSLIFQVFHALPDMSSPRGEQVGAVYGFVRDILQLLEQRQPDALIYAYDPPGPTFRDQVFDRYKADRGSMPDELVSQIPKTLEVLAALGIPVVSVPGFEADDVLATIARLCDEAGAQCFLVSGDKDCRQLITEHVSVFNIRKNEVFDATALEQDWGVRPEQVVDFQALVGDKVDNVPGVPTIGPKTAQTWLQTYGTLDNLLLHADDIAGAKGVKLRENRDLAFLSRQLVRLDSNVHVDIDWNATRIGPFDHARLRDMFNDFGFRSFADRFAKLDAAAHDAPAQVQACGDYHTVDTPEKLADLVAQLSQQKLISIDTETTNVLPRWAEIVGYSFSWKPGEGYYVPVRGPAGDTVLDPTVTLEALRPIFENPAIEKLGQNLKYDSIVLQNVGVTLAGATFDTMIASYLLDAGARNHNMDDLAKRYLDYTTITIDQVIGKGKDQKRMDEIEVAKVATYAAEDADVPLRLHPVLADQLTELGLTELNETVEVPLIEVLADMEFAGVRVDAARLAELSVGYTKRLNELEIEIEEIAGHPLNIASPKQLAQVLFQELKLPVMKKTKTGPSTDADVLEQLAGLHPLPRKIIEHRQYAKLKNTYVDALPKLIHPTTGRVHASFNQVVASTGRLSSSDPNLQNIPIRTAEGREIRSAFVAGHPGWKLLCADYSQIELRILAHFSEDPALSEAFANDEDIHTRVASEVFHVPLAEVTSSQRRTAKAVNFGVIYGQSPFGLAKTLDIPKEEAATFIDAYFTQYRGVAEYMTQTLVDCHNRGYLSTILGRRRAIEGVRLPESLLSGTIPFSRYQLNMPERTTVNSVIQGSAADMIKLAMIAISRRLRAEKLTAKMILQIHDELVFEAPPEELEALAELVTHEMSSVLPLRVPLQIDVKTGFNWADCE